jgi:hypothetical protein
MDSTNKGAPICLTNGSASIVFGSLSETISGVKMVSND